MRLTATLRPLNAIIVVGGGDSLPPVLADAHHLPYISGGAMVLGTMVDVDGPTVVEISDETPTTDLKEIASATLATASSGLMVRNVLGSVEVAAPMVGPLVAVKVFTNHAVEPDRIVIRPVLVVDPEEA